MATFTEKELAKIDKYDRYLVFGYIRFLESLLMLNEDDTLNLNAPSLVIHIILSYYYIGEFWDVLLCEPEEMKISEDKQSVTTTEKMQQNTWRSVYGNVSIYSLNNDGHYQWDVKFELVSKHNSNFKKVDCLIGLSTNNTDKIFFRNKDYPNYAWYGMGYKYHRYNWESTVGTTFKYGDIVRIDLNLKNQTLRYLKQDKDKKNEGFIDQNIKYKIETGEKYQYRLAMGVCYEFRRETKYTIVNFRSL